MSAALEQLETWMRSRENERLEFKEAQNNFHFEKLLKYCCALANERGGKIILEVSDRMPRQVVGTGAFENLERTKAGITEGLRIRVDVDEISHPNGRVGVFSVPSRPIGMPLQYEGAYWMRSGEDLLAMTPDQLKRILEESVPDFSVECLPGATLEDLDPAAIAKEQRLSGELLERAALLREAGIIEKIGRKYILSRGYYKFVGQRGVYTRKRGLDHETNKTLLLRHLRDAEAGSPISELTQVLPNLSPRQVKLLMDELREEGKAHLRGERKTARWFLSP